MTRRDYHKSKKLIRYNKKSNVKLNQNVDVSNTEYAKNNKLAQENKAHKALVKPKKFKITFKRTKEIN